MIGWARRSPILFARTLAKRMGPVSDDWGVNFLTFIFPFLEPRRGIKNPMAALHRVNVKINIYQQIRTECEPNMLAISLNAELSVLISLSVKVAFFPFTIQPFMR